MSVVRAHREARILGNVRLRLRTPPHAPRPQSLAGGRMCCQQEVSSDLRRAFAAAVRFPSFGLSTCQIGGYHGMIIRLLSGGKQRGQVIRMWDGSGAARLPTKARDRPRDRCKRLNRHRPFGAWAVRRRATLDADDP